MSKLCQNFCMQKKAFWNFFVNPSSSEFIFCLWLIVFCCPLCKKKDSSKTGLVSLDYHKDARLLISSFLAHFYLIKFRCCWWWSNDRKTVNSFSETKRSSVVKKSHLLFEFDLNSRIIIQIRPLCFAQKRGK